MTKPKLSDEQCFAIFAIGLFVVVMIDIALMFCLIEFVGVDKRTAGEVGVLLLFGMLPLFVLLLHMTIMRRKKV